MLNKPSQIFICYKKTKKKLSFIKNLTLIINSTKQQQNILHLSLTNFINFQQNNLFICILYIDFKYVQLSSNIYTVNINV